MLGISPTSCRKLVPQNESEPLNSETAFLFADKKLAAAT
jgi:hypothetical protein